MPWFAIPRALFSRPAPSQLQEMFPGRDGTNRLRPVWELFTFRKMDTTSLSPQVAEFAVDLRKSFPRSPRARLGPYVVAARALDKCRATLLGWNGEYNFDCLLDNFFFGFAELKAVAFKAEVAAGATDDDMIRWIGKNAASHTPAEIVAWNNKMRETKVSDLPVEAQVFLEDYIPKFVPAGRVVYRWFDVYDLEEGRP